MKLVVALLVVVTGLIAGAVLSVALIIGRLTSGMN